MCLFLIVFVPFRMINFAIWKMRKLKHFERATRNLLNWMAYDIKNLCILSLRLPVENLDDIIFGKWPFLFYFTILFYKFLFQVSDHRRSTLRPKQLTLLHHSNFTQLLLDPYFTSHFWCLDPAQPHRKSSNHRWGHCRFFQIKIYLWGMATLKK